MNELNGNKKLKEEIKYAFSVSPADDEETKAKKEKYTKEIERHAKEILNMVEITKVTIINYEE